MFNKAMAALVTVTIGVLAFIFLNTDTESQPELKVEPGFVVLASKGQATYVLLDVKNSGDGNDALVAVSSPVADKTELHTLEKGKMAPLKFVPLPANSEVLFTGTPHIMLLDLKRDLKLGELVQVTLDFKRSADQIVTFKVTQADGHDHEHGDEK